MSILRYSFIVGDFYGIKLPREKLALIDAHFLASSHHFYRSEIDELGLSRFHQDLFWKHIAQMMRIIAQGDFSQAFDNTRRGLNSARGWDPLARFDSGMGIPQARKHLFPDPEMFLDMTCDIRYQPGDTHPYDALLDRPKLKVAEIQLDLGVA